MDFCILGPLEVVQDGRQLPIGGAKRRALLAILVLHAGEAVSTDRLVEDLWGGNPPDTVEKALQVHVSGLRKLLEPERGRGEPRVLVTRAPGYMLCLEAGQLDLERFEAMVQTAGRQRAAGQLAQAAATLREALALWRGKPLADMAFESFAVPEIARLEEIRMSALEQRISIELDLGRHAELIAELEALVASHPRRERLRGQLMVALYRSERQADALETYRAARHELVEQLGIEPSRALHELERQILTHDPALDLPSSAPVSEPQARPTGTAGEGSPRATPFVGRERELAELRGALEGALAGHGALFTIGGEPGIGKTRLGDELATHAARLGAPVLWGRCWEEGGAPAYWPWVQAIRVLLRASEREHVRAQLGSGGLELAQIVPELGELLPAAGAALSATDAEGARFRLFDAAVSFLKNAARPRPLVLLLDDLHAADEPSLLLLRFLARDLADAPILVLGFHRDVDLRADNPLPATLAELAREPVARRLSLGGLDASEVGRLIELTTGAAAARRLVAAVHDQTEGNPLFVGEVVRLLDSGGMLGPDARGRAVGVALIPQSVRDVIARRLREVSPECREVLGVASVMGREFQLALLERAAACPADELLRRLDDAVTGRLITQVSEARGRYRFVHALVGEVLYDELPPSRRARTHRHVAETLEHLHAGNLEPHLAALARHFYEADPSGGDERVVQYARRAGDRAAELLAYEEATRLYEMALDGLRSKGHGAGLCELLLRLGDVRSRAGDGDLARDTFLEAADLARRLHTPELLARAALGYGGRFVWARASGDRRLVPLLLEALEVLGGGDSVLRARLMARLSGALRDEPSSERRDRLSEEAAGIARRLGDPATMTWALDARHLAIWGPDTARERIQIADEMLALAAQSREPEPELLAHDYRLYAFLELGELTRVEAELRAVVALAEVIKQPSYWWKVRAVEALLALLQGRFEEAERFVEQAGGFGSASQSATPATTHALQLFALRWEQGRLGELEADVSRLVAERPSYVVCRCVSTVVSCELGRREEAVEAFEQMAEDDFAALHRDDEWLLCMSLLAPVCAFLGDTRRAKKLHRALLPYGDRIAFGPPEFSTGCVSRSLGLLAWTVSSWQQADGHFARAVEVNEHMRASPWSAHSRHDWARMLLQRGRAQDRERALQLADASIASYHQLGMNGWAERAGAARRSAEPPPLSQIS